MILRAWQKGDIPTIAALERSCFQDAWTKEMLLDCLRYPHYRCFLIEEGGQVCGYCCLTVLFEDAEVANIAVSPAYRNRGFAKAMLNEMHVYAQSLGATQCFLEVRKGNTPAISLYQKQGYEPYGERKGYYGDGEDALLMKKIF